jgi:Flp pilus assembly protein TadD
VAILALLVRLVFLLENSRSDAFRLLLGDARVYDTLARQIAAGRGAGDHVFYQAPLYPYFLAAVYRLLGSGPAGVRIVQALLGSLSCLLLAHAGRLFFSRRIGLLAGILLAVYPPAIFFDGTIQKTVLDTFLLSGLLCVLGMLSTRLEVDRDTPPAKGGEASRRRTGSTALVSASCGVVLGLLSLTRENALVFVPILVGWLVWMTPDHRRPQRVVPAALFLAGCCLVLMPVGVRNAVRGGEFHITTSQGGSNFYIGNNPYATGTYAPLVAGRGDAQFERLDATRLAEEATGRTLTPGQVSRYWTGRALSFIRAQPDDWVRLMGRKLTLALNSAETGDTEDQYTYASWSILLRVLTALLHWGILFPLAAAGIVLTRRDSRRLLVWHALTAAYLVTLVSFFVVARYRMPLAPMLLPFAATAFLAGIDRIRGGRPREDHGAGRLTHGSVVPVIIGVTVAAALVANWPLARKASFMTITHANLAAALLDAGDTGAAGPGRDAGVAAGGSGGNSAVRSKELSAATRHLDAALRLDPKNANAHHLMGVVLAEAGQGKRAEEEYRRAIELEPGRALTYFKMAELFSSEGDLEGAAEAYRTGLALDPLDPKAHNNLGTTLAKLGRLDEALFEIKRAKELSPDLPDAEYNLGLVLAQNGRLEQAEEIFRRLIEEQPGHLAARQNLATICLRTGRAAEGAREMEELLRRDPRRLRTALPLILLYATHPDASVRNGPRAVELGERALRDSPGRDPLLLDALAAGYAETGRYELAVRTAEEAAAAARARGQADIAARIELHRGAYNHGRPWRVEP